MLTTQQQLMLCVNSMTVFMKSSSFMKSQPDTVANASSMKSWNADPGPADHKTPMARTSSTRFRSDPGGPIRRAKLPIHPHKNSSKYLHVCDAGNPYAYVSRR
jgi:hypothetical protein